MFFPIWIDEIGKNQDKSINETSVSSISPDWSKESISIKSVKISLDLSIDKSDTDFVDWLFRESSAPLHLFPQKHLTARQ